MEVVEATATAASPGHNQMNGDPQLRPLSSAKQKKGKAAKKGKDAKDKVRGPKSKLDSDSVLGSLVVLDQDGAEEVLAPRFRPDGVHAYRNERPLPTDATHVTVVASARSKFAYVDIYRYDVRRTRGSNRCTRLGSPSVRAVRAAARR